MHMNLTLPMTFMNRILCLLQPKCGVHYQPVLTCWFSHETNDQHEISPRHRIPLPQTYQGDWHSGNVQLIPGE